MYYTMYYKEYEWHPWDWMEDQITGHCTKLTQIEYWSAWSILHDAYILDMDDEFLWVELKNFRMRDCWTAEELKNEFECPYNKTIKAYEPPKIGEPGLFEWHNRWSETQNHWLKEIQKNFNRRDDFALTPAQWDRVRSGYCYA